MLFLVLFLVLGHGFDRALFDRVLEPIPDRGLDIAIRSGIDQTRSRP
ncbi:MAG: hypothetical protein ACAF42_13480 [Limnothrix sp. BL-A-16]